MQNPAPLSLLTLLALLSIVAYGKAAECELKQFSRREPHMGVEWEVVLYAHDEAIANRALDAAMARIAALDKALSDYDLESELSQLSATSTVDPAKATMARTGFPEIKLSDDLWTVLAFAQQVSADSDGALDVTVGPLTKLWRRARRQKELPPPELFGPAKAAVGFRFLKLDCETRTAKLMKPNMRLDLGGIAKGYAAEEAVQAVKALGISRVLVRGSGDIAVGDAPPGETGWKIGIAPLDPDLPPTRFVRLANRAVSTSGDSRQHMEIGGRRYSHILDPRTGLGIEGRSSVTVVAPHGLAADSLDTAISILGPDLGLALIAHHPDAELLMVAEIQGGQQHEVQSKGFSKFLIRDE